MAPLGPIFFDTTILLGGLIDFGTTEDAQRIFNAIADSRVKTVQTAWHCCLEFYSVSTRLPEEFRLTPENATLLIEQEIISRLHIHQLPEQLRPEFLRSLAADRIVGGRVYDAHIAEVARSAGCRILVTENKRHFMPMLRYGISVLSAGELASRLSL